MSAARPPTRPAADRPARRQRYRPRQTTTTDDTDRRQTTDASEQNNTGPLGGPVITVNWYIGLDLFTLIDLKWFYANVLIDIVQATIGKLFSIEDQGQTDRVIVLPRPYALDIGLLHWLLISGKLWSWTHTHTQKHKFRRQSYQKIEWKQTVGQTDGQTDATDCFAFPTKAIAN